MPPTGGLLYRDQEAAERAADKQRAARVDLVNKLIELNVTLDSLSLHNLIEAELDALA